MKSFIICTFHQNTRQITERMNRRTRCGAWMGVKKNLYSISVRKPAEVSLWKPKLRCDDGIKISLKRRCDITNWTHLG
jgi:hypothetical protein